MGSSFGSGFVTGFGSAFLQFALERFASFGSLAWREIRVIWGVEDELRKLQRTFLKIQDLVDFMEGSPLRFYGGSSAWQIWFEDMRKLAYDADALLDHVSLHLSSFCAENSVSSGHEKQVTSMVLSSFDNVKIPHMISEMQKKLDELVKEMESLVMIEKTKFDAKTTFEISSQFSNLCLNGSAFIDDETVVGRVGDKECIVDLLGRNCERNKFSVIPIVGMAGIGKTTLARLVYDEDKVSFEKRIWVSISMDFDVVKITKSIIEYATLSSCNLSDLSSLQATLKGILCGSKYLLVLDDYWSENYDDWRNLSSPFRFGSKGSTVIVTTRSTKVSSIVSSFEAHKLKILSDDDCWELIKKTAHPNVDVGPNLESIGRRIAQKSKGLPLVAKTLGNVLHGKSTEEEWYSVLENELWDMPQGKNIFLHLMQSYLYLPTHLQKCFGYCSIFPKNYEFEIDELIHLWIGEGFVQPVGSRRLEDLGRDYLNDLCSRSLFEQCISTPTLIRYKMHDLVHDMARLVSKDICFHVKNDTKSSYPLFGTTCHFFLFHDNIQPLELKASLKNERLRTFLVTSIAVKGEVHPQLFSHLQFLRVLGLSRCGLIELAGNIDQLSYLRYLNLSKNPISHLPESMCKLVALQVLKLIDCFQLRELPKDMKNLLSLRHLDMDVKGQLQAMPLQLGRLTNLQSLSAYIVGIRKGNGIQELKNLKWLRGSLCIKNIHYVSNEEDAKEAQLDLKTGLDKLELQWRKLRNGLNSQLLDQRRGEQAKVLESLRPHQNLKELVIENYCGTVYPSWLSGSPCKFTSIHLQGLKYCGTLPSLGELPFLKSFDISDMPCLEYVDSNFYGSSNEVKFCSLEFFHVHGMLMLKEWTTGINSDDMPHLKTFTIHDCPNLTSLPAKLRNLSNSNISYCPLLLPVP